MNDKVLLKIRRRYSESEAVAYLNKKISDLMLENGILKSELSECRDISEKEIKDLKDKIEQLRLNETKTKRKWTKDEVIIGLRKELKQAIDKKNKLKADNEALTIKLVKLQQPLT